MFYFSSLSIVIMLLYENGVFCVCVFKIYASLKQLTKKKKSDNFTHFIFPYSI